MFPPRRGVCASLALSDVLSDIDEESCRLLPGTFSRSAQRYSASHVQADPGTGCPASVPPCTPSRGVQLPAVKERFSWLWRGHYFHSARDNARLVPAQVSQHREAPSRHQLTSPFLIA